MEKTQAKLKECLEKQTSMKTLELLSDQLTSMRGEVGENMETMKQEAVIDASETTTLAEPLVDGRGENKAMISMRSRKRKHRIVALEEKRSRKEEKPKPKPRYYCEF